MFFPLRALPRCHPERLALAGCQEVRLGVLPTHPVITAYLWLAVDRWVLDCCCLVSGCTSRPLDPVSPCCIPARTCISSHRSGTARFCLYSLLSPGSRVLVMMARGGCWSSGRRRRACVWVSFAQGTREACIPAEDIGIGWSAMWTVPLAPSGSLPAPVDAAPPPSFPPRFRAEAHLRYTAGSASPPTHPSCAASSRSSTIEEDRRTSSRRAIPVSPCAIGCAWPIVHLIARDFTPPYRPAHIVCHRPRLHTQRTQ
jgi:hypothetical protein